MNTKVKRILELFACIIAMNIIGVSDLYAAGDLEWNINYPGGDYLNFASPVDNPMLCKEACFGDPKCKVFSYVKAGFLGSPYGQCWLKSVIANPVYDQNVISGVKPN